MSRTKLTDKQKKKIIARYVETTNYRQVAREFGISDTSVRRIIAKEPNVTEKVAQKKEENTLDMFKYMEGQKGKVQELLSNIVVAMNDPEKLARANVRDLATAYGIIFDKITQSGPKASDELLQRAREILGGIDGVIK